MKNIYIFLVITSLFIISSSSYGGEVDSLLVKRVASNFLNSNRTDLRTLGPVQEQLILLDKYIRNDTVAMYIYGYSNGGWVIVPADNAIEPIIGYSFSDNYQKENIPPAMEWLLQTYVSEIMLIKQLNLNEQPEIWNLYLNNDNSINLSAKSVNSIGPLLKTSWGQGSNHLPTYNLYCPGFILNKSLTGCVATAMAQMMGYFNYPDKGNGSHSYTCRNYGVQKASFGNADYIWNIGGEESFYFMIPKIMYHCGVSVNMEYGTSISTATGGAANRAFNNFFRYKTKVISATTNSTIMKNILNDSLPIFYGAVSGTNNGHAFVIDGYNSDGKFHVNWGVDGAYQNVYFSLNLLNPGRYNFNNSRYAFYAIPDTTPSKIKLEEVKYDRAKISWIKNLAKKEANSKYYVYIKKEEESTWSDSILVEKQNHHTFLNLEPSTTYTTAVKSYLTKTDDLKELWSSNNNEIQFTTSDCVDTIELIVSITISDLVSSFCGTNNSNSATLRANARGGLGSDKYVYKWFNGNSNIGEGQTITVNSDGNYTVEVTDSCQTATDVVHINFASVECSSDPNEIAGPIGYSEPQMVAQKDNMNYTIYYENDPDFASAPATRVKITYPVNEKQNINSFRLSDFGFGSFVFTVPQNLTSYYKRLDVSDSLGVWVDVTAGIDIVNNELFWILQSIDPHTGIEPISAQMGFLPINNRDIGNGEGYVNFNILPSTITETGDTILAKASIIFDDNAPIETNIWSNVIDAVAPQSILNGALNPVDILSAIITFSAQDDINGSGLKNVSVYVSENNSPYELYITTHPDSTETFTGSIGYEYRFISIAEDNVGNIEEIKSETEFILNLNLPPTDLLLSANIFYENDEVETQIGYFTTEDNNPYLPFIYTLVEGDGDDNNNLFIINNNTLYTNHNFNCTLETEFSIRVRTTDIGGLWFEKSFNLEMIKINYTDTARLSDVICQGIDYDFFGTNLTTSGIYYHNLESINGCDSIIELTLTVNPVYSTPISEEICYGQTYDFFGNELSEAGDYQHNLQTIEGCDSIINLTLTIIYDYRTPVTASICEGNSYDFFGTLLTEAGNYEHTLQSVNNCDSIIELTLTINPIYTTPLFVEICQGQIYDFFGTELSESADYHHILQTIDGCDSIINLTLVVNPTYITPITASICEGGTYDFFGTLLTEAGNYEHTLQSVNNCDSIIEVALTVNPAYLINSSVEICDGSTYDFYGIELTEAGEYQHTLYTTEGCDSIINLTLITRNVHITETSAAICYGDTHHFFGRELSEEGIHDHTLESIHGCDSIISLTLSIYPELLVDLGEDRTISENETINLNAGDGFNSYLWSTGEDNQEIVINHNNDLDSLVVWVLISNENDCEGSDSITVYFQKNIGVDAVLITHDDFVLYPNPTRDKITIEFKNAEERSVEISDMGGKIVYNRIINDKITEISVSGLKPGTYTIIINNIHKKRFIISQ